MLIMAIKLYKDAAGNWWTSREPTCRKPLSEHTLDPVGDLTALLSVYKELEPKKEQLDGIFPNTPVTIGSNLKIRTGYEQITLPSQ